MDTMRKPNETNRRESNTSGVEFGHVRIQHLPFNSIRPSPENDKLYRPVNPDDPEITALANSIREHGILEPLVVTADRWILSGHRRYAAAKLAGLKLVPCRIEPIVRKDDPNGFLVALREHNRQREKSFDEKVRETVVTLNPEEAYSSLVQERKLRSRVKVAPLELREAKRRAEITEAKEPFMNAILKILDDFKDYLPVSERLIHYNLLNDPPLVHASKPNSHYQNEVRFSHSLSELVTRARIVGLIPEDAIEDETRPVVTWNCHREPGAFIDHALNRFLKGYWRDLMQSQPNQVELLVEKNTAAKIIEPVAMEFCIPMTSGRGFASLPPRIAMKNRFRKSGKERLVLIILSDFDPDGEEIAHSFARSMRDDFGIVNITAIKAGLTFEQVNKFNLPSSLDAKKTSKNHPRFVAKYGVEQKVFELEALPPERLQRIAREAIDAVIDRELFNKEIVQEKKDSLRIEGLRRSVVKMLEHFKEVA